MFEYIESELKDIDTDLLDRNACEYGRACKQAAYTLLAKLYLNAKIYTGNEHWTDCITYCKEVIKAGYTLEDDYAKLFNADNDKRTNEIIFSLPVDAARTVSWGSTTYIICGAVSNASDYQKPEKYGVTSAWGMFRIRGEVPALFQEGDGRAMFFTEGQTQTVDVIDNQSNGYFVEKWTNLTDAGEAASNTVDVLQRFADLLAQGRGPSCWPTVAAVGKQVAGSEGFRPRWSAGPACLRRPLGPSDSQMAGTPLLGRAWVSNTVAPESRAHFSRRDSLAITSACFIWLHPPGK